MRILLNKDEFKDREQIYNLLVKFEQEMNDENKLGMAAILEKLKKFKIQINVATEEELLNHANKVTTSTSIEQ